MNDNPNGKVIDEGEFLEWLRGKAGEALKHLDMFPDEDFNELPEKPVTIGMVILQTKGILLFISDTDFHISKTYHVTDEQLCHTSVYEPDFRIFTPLLIADPDFYFVHETEIDEIELAALDKTMKEDTNAIIEHYFPMYQFMDYLQSPFSSKLVIRLDHKAYAQYIINKDKE